ncbi:MAG TPA: Gfo/Idh/MocA family oxidoreductase [Planctomycetes bacterium]|nr:Gfo/Idh/MocA family oxidoreductase [Planctomycetota bacterium]
MPAEKESIRVAMVGQRFMGRAHSNALHQVGRFFDGPLVPILDTVAGRDRGALDAFAERWGWQRTTTRWRSIAADPRIELVDLVTPNHLHAEQAVAMLEANKHVACEKPLAGTLADARAMRDAAARAKGVRTFVWFHYRRCPALATAWRLVREGRIGRVYHVRATYLQSWGGADTPMSWRFRKKTAGSGALGDLGSHLVDLARFLTGDEVREVRGAVLANFIQRRPSEDGRGMGRSNVDDAASFLCVMRSGATASFEATRVAGPHHNAHSIELNGEEGSLRFEFDRMNDLLVHDASLDVGSAGWRRIQCTHAGAHPYADAWWPDGHGLGYEHGFVNMLADILAELGGGRARLPLPDFEDAYRTQRVLEAATISAREGCAVPLSEVR